MAIILLSAFLSCILTAAVARFIGAYRDDAELSQMSMVIGMMAFVLVFLAGLFTHKWLGDQGLILVAILPFIGAAIAAAFAAIVWFVLHGTQLVIGGIDRLANIARAFFDAHLQRRNGEDQ